MPFLVYQARLSSGLDVRAEAAPGSTQRLALQILGVDEQLAGASVLDSINHEASPIQKQTCTRATRFGCKQLAMVASSRRRQRFPN